MLVRFPLVEDVIALHGGTDGVEMCIRDRIYSADLADLRTRLDELISIGKQILTKLANL